MKRVLRFTGNIIKWAIRLLVVALLVMLIGGVYSYFNPPGQPPSPDNAQWAIQTYSNDSMRIPSRIYYATTLDYQEDGTPVISGYWSFDGKNFHKQKGERSFPYNIYGDITVIRRGSVEKQ